MHWRHMNPQCPHTDRLYLTRTYSNKASSQRLPRARSQKHFPAVTYLRTEVLFFETSKHGRRGGGCIIIMLNSLISFNPKQVLGFAATTNTYRHKSITDERTWQDLAIPYKVCRLCTRGPLILRLLPPRQLTKWRHLACSMGSVMLLFSYMLIGVKVDPALAASGDWPMYLHDTQRTSSASDTTITTANAAQLGPKWTFKTGGGIAAQTIVVGNTAYIGSWDGYEYALNATTGVLEWKTFLGQT